MKNSLTPISAAVIAALSIPASASDLIISEYVEGSSYQKAIELFNSGSSAVDLSGYQLVKYNNGDQAKTSVLSLTGSLPAGATYVIAHSQGDDAIKAKAQLLNRTALNFNGDDPIALQTADGTTVDLIGEFGKVSFAKDKTLARKPGSQSSATYTPDQWDVLAKNTIEGLGKAPEGGVTPPPAWKCQGELTQIFDVQGDGDRSPLVPEGQFAGDQVTVEGIVTKRVESLYNGFFLQAEAGDDNPLTSDGIFVFTGSTPDAAIKEGSRVCLQGQVREYYNQTQLSLTKTNFQVLEEDAADVEAAPLVLNPEVALEEQLEAYEGMLVSTTGSDLVVTRNFGFDYGSYRNNMVLSLSTPLYKATQKHPALSDEAKALAAENSKGHLFVDTDQKPKNGVIPYFENFNAETGYIRIGDRVENLEGVIAYSYGEYRLIPETGENLDEADFVHEFTDRTEEPAVPADADLKVASFNVLNYFNSGVGGASNPTGQNRGAGSNEADFLKQQTKIVNALLRIDADIVGLMEIENNGFGELSAIQDLVSALNAELPNTEDHYEFVSTADSAPIGTDAITVGLLYRPAHAKLAKAADIVAMPEQHAKFQALEKGKEVTKTLFKGQRNALVQTFEVKTPHGRKRPLTIAVNHFKSKGSQCYNDFTEYEQPVPFYRGRVDKKKAKRVAGFEEDLQGSCNEFRVSAAEVLGEWMRSNTAGDVIMLGDYNAYGKEDPIRLLTDYNGEGRKLKTAPYTFIGDQVIDGAEGRELSQGYGYVNLAEYAHGTKAFSYSYDGELGSLDHAIGSGSVVAKLTEAADWHINSVENNLFEYSRKYSGSLEKSDNSFSSSDHDPVILTLDYSQAVSRLVFTRILRDAKVSLEMEGFLSDTIARYGISRPEFSQQHVGKTGLFRADGGLQHLRAYEIVGKRGILVMDSVTTAWALILDRSFEKQDLLAMDSYSLNRAKLDVSRERVTDMAIALELADKIGIDSIKLANAMLDNPNLSLDEVLIDVLGMDLDRRTLRRKVRLIRFVMHPRVRIARQRIIRENR
ncbi:ExeM/NucH family extracellular endonuclease [Sansalvadorimonas sp. 2012CJ34-2]|uniref:ExeM/NucH family extracellular endonuclease n=1 Tax=Parendozoicomonas callyspongiae TaxID=2942213 RepID=A0ABT0PCG3_9GAMM|nr:ExeM/NucH family extracellular endonuclease [Sansalvadorimonas sp. 2012CJ34-2]MCL6268736.1 ExeM/NucH family extracellular endonuclease [Sansalvadorimonas sp. 2012CJ34-2]